MPDTGTKSGKRKTPALGLSKMSSNTKVLNVSNGWRIKRSQAIRRVEQCLSVWEEFGHSIRDLNKDERLTRQAEQAKQSTGLVYFVEGKDGKQVAKPYFAELPDVVYRPAEANAAQNRAGRLLVMEANQFAALSGDAA